MPTFIPSRPIDGLMLTTTADTALYTATTASAGSYGFLLSAVEFCNTTTAPVTITLRIGSAATTSHNRLDAYPLGGKEPFTYEVGQSIQIGQVLSAGASIGSCVTITVHGGRVN